MNEPQVWAVIGVLAATLVGAITLIVTLVLRVITAQFDGLRGELNGRIDGLRGELNGRLDVLDRDVQVIADRVFRAPEQ